MLLRPFSGIRGCFYGRKVPLTVPQRLQNMGQVKQSEKVYLLRVTNHSLFRTIVSSPENILFVNINSIYIFQLYRFRMADLLVKYIVYLAQADENEQVNACVNTQ